MTTAVPAGASRSRRSQSRRQHILDTAKTAFLEKGYADTTIDNLVHVMGGSKGTIYNHFRNKADLFEAIVKQEATHFLENLSRAISPRAGRGGDLVMLFEGFVTAVTAPDAIRLLRTVISEQQNHPEVGSLYRSVMRQCRQEMRRLIRQSCLSANDRPGMAVRLEILVSMLIADLQLSILRGDAVPQPFSPAAMSRLWRRIGLLQTALSTDSGGFGSLSRCPPARSSS